MKKDLKVLWEGEWVRVISPKDEPYEVLDERDIVIVFPIIEEEKEFEGKKVQEKKIGIRLEKCPPYLIKDTSGEERYYTVITGKLEKGEENAEEAAVRELREESGIVYKKGKIHKVFENLPICKSTDMRATLYVIEIEEYKKEKAKGDGTRYEKESSTVWVTEKELDEILKKPNIDFLLFAVNNLVLERNRKIINKEEVLESNGMMHKVTYLGNSLYQLDDNEIPIDREELLSLKKQSKKLTSEELTEWIEEIDKKGSGIIQSFANTGVVVNMYEVDHSEPLDPNKETQEIAKHLDEYKDFITQYIYPDTEIDDLVVTLRQDLKKEEVSNEDEKRQNSLKSSLKNKINNKNWRNIFFG